MNASNNRLSTQVHSDSGGDYVVVYMVDPVEVGQSFQLWPLHMTIVPWFTAPRLETVVEALAPVAAACKPFEFKIDRRETSGPHKVMLVQQNQQLQSLHERLLSVVEGAGWAVQGRFIGTHFMPHVTQKRGRDAEGTHCLDVLHIAEALPQGYRKVVAQLELMK